MAHHRGLVITLVLTVVLGGLFIGVIALATNDTDESVLEEVSAYRLGLQRSTVGSATDVARPLAVVSEDPLSSQVLAVPGRTFDVEPSSKEFGAQPLGSQGDPTRFEVHVRGPSDRSARYYTDVFLYSKDFVVVEDTCHGPLTDREFPCSVAIVFAPKAAGPRSTTATFLFFETGSGTSGTFVRMTGVGT